MRVDYHVTFEDFRRLNANQTGGWRRASSIVSIGVFGSLCLATGFFGYRSGEVAGWWVLPAIFAALLVSVPFLQRWELWRTWRRRHGVVEPHVVAEFGDAGVFLASGGERTFLEWRAFSHYVETPHLFLLYQGPTFFRYFPRRVFGGDTALATFRELLRERIGETKFRARQPAFPVAASPVTTAAAEPPVQPPPAQVDGPAPVAERDIRPVTDPQEAGDGGATPAR